MKELEAMMIDMIDMLDDEGLMNMRDSIWGIYERIGEAQINRLKKQWNL